MKILQITVSTGLTVNLGHYESARCDVEFVSEIGEVSPVDAVEFLQAHARKWVEAEADRVLEKHGNAARYTTESRFDILVARKRIRNNADGEDYTVGRIVLVIPNGLDLGEMAQYYTVPTIYLDHTSHTVDTEYLRLSHAVQVAEDYASKKEARMIVVQSLDDLPRPRLFNPDETIW